MEGKAWEKTKDAPLPSVLTIIVALLETLSHAVVSESVTAFDAW